MPPELPQGRNSFLIPLSIVLAGIMVAGAVYFGGSRGVVTSDSPEALKEAVVEPVSAKDHILGSLQAELIVVEYSDLECPFCKVFHSTMHQIVNEYEGKVAWVYRHFPIKELHSKAVGESEASECAYDQGGNTMFWKYIDKLLSVTESNNSLDTAELPKIAGELGLDVPTFNTCLETGKFSEKIAKDVEAAVLAGARGTPYSLILTKDGKQTPINGAEPIEQVRIKIDALLKQ